MIRVGFWGIPKCLLNCIIPEVALESCVHRDQLVGAHAALRVAVVEEEHLGEKDGNVSYELVCRRVIVSDKIITYRFLSYEHDL